MCRVRAKIPVESDKGKGQGRRRGNQNLRSRATHSTSLARERLLRRLARNLMLVCKAFSPFSFRFITSRYRV